LNIIIHSDEKEKTLSPGDVIIELGNIDDKKDKNDNNKNVNNSDNTLKNNNNKDQKDNQGLIVGEISTNNKEIKIVEKNETKKLQKQKLVKHEEKNIDYKEMRKNTIKYIKKLYDLFEISDENLDYIIRNYITVYIKKISDNIKKRNPKLFKEQVKITNKQSVKDNLAKDGGFPGFLFLTSQIGYYEIHFEDFLYLFLKILNFITGLKIKLEVKKNKQIFIRVFYEEDRYDEAAEFLKYKMQLKPYSKIYEKFYDSCVYKKNDDKTKKQKQKAEEQKIDPSKLISNENPKDKIQEDSKSDEKKINGDLEKIKQEVYKDENVSKKDLEKEKEKDNESFLKSDVKGEVENLIKNDNLKNKNQQQNEVELKGGKGFDGVDLNNYNKNLIEASPNNIKNLDQVNKDAVNNIEEEEDNMPRLILLKLQKSKEIMTQLLKQNFEFEEVDINDQHYFPPYFPMDNEKIVKFRKYLGNDDIHECANEEQYKLWINMEDYQESEEEESFDSDNPEAKNELETQEKNNNKIYDVLKEIPCEKSCFYNRNIDRLRIIASSLDEVINFDVLRNFDQIYETDLLINNYPEYESKTTAKNLIFTKLNVFSSKVQGQLVRLFRNFCGEKIAFYFLWYCFFLEYIIILGVFSAIIFVLTLFTTFFASIDIFGENSGLNVLDAIYVLYSFFVAVWSSILIKAWKSKESIYAYIWGTDDFESDEPYRDEFIHDEMQTLIFTQRIPMQKAWKSFLKISFSWFIMLLFCVASVFIMIEIFRIKDLDMFKNVNTNSTIDTNSTININNRMEINWFEIKIFPDEISKKNYFNQLKTDIPQNDTIKTDKKKDYEGTH